MGGDHSKSVEFIIMLCGIKYNHAVYQDAKYMEYWEANKNEIDIFHEISSIPFQKGSDTRETGVPFSVWGSLIMFSGNTELLKKVIQNKKPNIFKDSCYNGSNAIETLIAHKDCHAKLTLDWLKILTEVGRSQISPDEKKKNPQKFINTYCRGAEKHGSKTYLQMAAKFHSNDKDLFSYLIDSEFYGSDLVAFRDDEGNTILHTLVVDDKFEGLLKLFLSSGKIGDITSKKLLSVDGNSEVVKNVWLNKMGQTPLMLACRQSAVAIVKELISADVGGSVTDKASSDSPTALHYAAACKYSWDHEKGKSAQMLEAMLAMPGANDLVNSPAVFPAESIGKYRGGDDVEGDGKFIPLALAKLRSNTQAINVLTTNGAKE